MSHLKYSTIVLKFLPFFMFSIFIVAGSIGCGEANTGVIAPKSGYQPLGDQKKMEKAVRENVAVLTVEPDQEN